MNKLTKIICMVAAGMLALGIALAGGAWSVAKLTGGQVGSIDLEGLHSENRQMLQNATEEQEELAQGFHSIELAVECHQVYVQRGDSFSISNRYDPNSSKLEWTVSDGVLRVTETKESLLSGDSESLWARLWERKNAANTLTITCPPEVRLTLIAATGVGELSLQGLELERLEADMDMGDVQLAQCRTSELKLSTSMGDIKLKDSTADWAKLSSQMGSVEADNFVCKSGFDCTAAMGDVELSGDFRGQTSLDCAMGNIDVELVGSQAEYGYELESRGGSVQIEDEHRGSSAIAAGLGADFLKAYTAAGGIELEFDER